MSTQEPILLLGAEMVAASEASLLPKLNLMLCEITGRKYAKKKPPLIEIDGKGCWNWLGGLVDNGYGIIMVNYKREGIHRYFFKKFGGKIPEGLTIDHLCRNPSCCNPNHMEPVTIRENVLRGVSSPAENSRKENCKRGHPLKGENLYIYSLNGKKQRMCKKCRLETLRRFQQKQRDDRRLLLE